jgi:hypothetical protein
MLGNKAALLTVAHQALMVKLLINLGEMTNTGGKSNDMVKHVFFCPLRA